MPVERRYELETLRRSLAMLRPGAPALDREEAMRLVRELQDLERQLRTLRRGLQDLLSGSGGTKSAAWRGRRPPVS
jgi:vacuolar-type H+-ATPase subunit D/Vma8